MDRYKAADEPERKQCCGACGTKIVMCVKASTDGAAYGNMLLTDREKVIPYRKNHTL